MPVRKCLEGFKRPDLLKDYDKFIEGGMNEHEAARNIILSEHQTIHNDLNGVRTALKAKVVKFTAPKTVDTKSIHEEYKGKAEQAAKDFTQKQQDGSTTSTTDKPLQPNEQQQKEQGDKAAVPNIAKGDSKVGADGAPAVLDGKGDSSTLKDVEVKVGNE